MKIWCVYHFLGASLVKAKTEKSALRKAKQRFGTYGGPYRIPQPQDEAIAFAQAMGAGVIE